jgi:subtilase family serine protease
MRHFMRSERRIVENVPFVPGRAAATALALTVALLSAAAATGAPGGSTPQRGASRPAAADPVAASSDHLGSRVATASLHDDSPRPPDTSRCRREFGGRCYGPAQLAAAYGVRSLWKSGTTGHGRTIAIVDSYGSPTLRSDVARFARAFGLPKAHLVIDRPDGPIPAFHRGNDDQVGWATETTLDVDYAHALAPDATIRVLETPSDETEGRHGLPAMMRAERWLWAGGHHRADVVSQSFGATEQTFAHHRQIRRLHHTFVSATNRHLTLLAASGDEGATDLRPGMVGTYDHRVQSWPSADPLVTSVGGLSLALAKSGRRTSPDAIWNDASGAGGGGRSAVFGRPGWQDGVRSRVRSSRGVPDIAMSADPERGALVWTTFGGQPKGWQLVGGTSLATPLFAGIVALADQAAGHDLGHIDRAIYRLGGSGAAGRRRAGITDVRDGSNSHDGVRGWSARRGYDLASGWGSVDAAKFVPALVAAVR